MRNKFSCFYLGLVVFMSTCSWAQQEVGLLFTTNHMNIINPAFIGVNGEDTFLKSSIRKQWSGVEYAPETQIVSFGSNLANKLKFGLSFVNDKTFIEKELTLGIDLTYKLQLDSISNLHFGIKSSLVNYSVDLSGLETYNVVADPSLYSITNNSPNFGLGLVYTYKTFYIALSVPRLLNVSKARNNEGYASLFSDTPHYYLAGGYDFQIAGNKDFTLKPSCVLRYVKGSPLSIDLNSMIDYNNFFELGFLYRKAINSSNIFGGKVIFKLKDRLNIGYGYEVGTAQLASAGVSNELFLQFNF
jgi:type IX secretion system PorP/SprF family membrane protein